MTRDAGLPPEYPNDVVFRTSVCGTELTRIPIPGRAERYTSREGPDTWWPTPEPPHRINQLFLEPILLQHTAALPGVQLLNRTQVTGFVQRAGGAVTYDLVGPVCESGDWLARDRALAVEPGDVLAMMAAGAYGFTMASNYNTRGRAAEVLVDGDQVHVIRRRENPADLFALETIVR